MPTFSTVLSRTPITRRARVFATSSSSLAQLRSLRANVKANPSGHSASSTNPPNGYSLAHIPEGFVWGKTRIGALRVLYKGGRFSGLLLFGPNWSFAVAMFVIKLLVTVLFLYVLREPETSGSWTLVGGIVLCTISLLLFFITVLKDPGLPRLRNGSSRPHTAIASGKKSATSTVHLARKRGGERRGGRLRPQQCSSTRELNAQRYIQQHVSKENHGFVCTQDKYSNTNGIAQNDESYRTEQMKHISIGHGNLSSRANTHIDLNFRNSPITETTSTISLVEHKSTQIERTCPKLMEDENEEGVSVEAENQDRFPFRDTGATNVSSSFAGISKQTSHTCSRIPSCVDEKATLLACAVSNSDSFPGVLAKGYTSENLSCSSANGEVSQGVALENASGKHVSKSNRLFKTRPRALRNSSSERSQWESHSSSVDFDFSSGSDAADECQSNASERRQHTYEANKDDAQSESGTEESDFSQQLHGKIRFKKKVDVQGEKRLLFAYPRRQPQARRIVALRRKRKLFAFYANRLDSANFSPLPTYENVSRRFDIVKSSRVENETTCTKISSLLTSSLSAVLKRLVCRADDGHSSDAENLTEESDIHEARVNLSQSGELTAFSSHMKLSDRHATRYSTNEYRYKLTVRNSRPAHFCVICRIAPPAGSFHCDECGVCIEGYDHHCPWTSKCVGQGNTKEFYLWICSALITIFYFGFAASLLKNPVSDQVVEEKIASVNPAFV